MSVDVSVVIRTKNEEECIGETLRRVRDQAFSGHYEIIIVDSGSTDSTVDIVKKHNVRLLQMPQKEFTYGRSLNIGASSANGTFVVNLSAHAFPSDRNWLASLIAGFEQPDVAGVYGRLLTIGRLNPFDAFRGEFIFGKEKTTFRMTDKRLLKRLIFCNSNSAIRKDVWRRFKFNEKVPYAEDIFWQREVMEAGFSIVYTPDAAVYHTHRVSIYDAYRCSRDCAYTLALMQKKRQSIPLVLYDMAVLLSFAPQTIYKNVRYIWENDFTEHLKITPLYVMSSWVGWLAGRVKHRLKRE